MVQTHTHTHGVNTLKPLTSKEKSNAFNFVFFSLLVMILTGAVAYYCQNYARKQRGEEEMTVSQFLNMDLCHH